MESVLDAQYPCRWAKRGEGGVVGVQCVAVEWRVDEKGDSENGAGGAGRGHPIGNDDTTATTALFFVER